MNCCGGINGATGGEKGGKRGVKFPRAGGGGRKGDIGGRKGRTPPGGRKPAGTELISDEDCIIFTHVVEL